MAVNGCVGTQRRNRCSLDFAAAVDAHDSLAEDHRDAGTAQSVHDLRDLEQLSRVPQRNDRVTQQGPRLFLWLSEHDCRHWHTGTQQLIGHHELQWMTAGEQEAIARRDLLTSEKRLDG